MASLVITSDDIIDSDHGRWIPDADRDRCSHHDCGLPFNKALRRRHHCRRCGEIFCGLCTSNTVVVEGAKFTGVRSKLSGSHRLCVECFAAAHAKAARRHFSRIKFRNWGEIFDSAEHVAAEQTVIAQVFADGRSSGGSASKSSGSSATPRLRLPWSRAVGGAWTVLLCGLNSYGAWSAFRRAPSLPRPKWRGGWWTGLVDRRSGGWWLADASSMIDFLTASLAHFELLLVARAGWHAMRSLSYLPEMGPAWREQPPVSSRGVLAIGIPAFRGVLAVSIPLSAFRRKIHASERWKKVSEGFDWLKYWSQISGIRALPLLPELLAEALFGARRVHTARGVRSLYRPGRQLPGWRLVKWLAVAVAAVVALYIKVKDVARLPSHPLQWARGDLVKFVFFLGQIMGLVDIGGERVAAVRYLIFSGACAEMKADEEKAMDEFGARRLHFVLLLAHLYALVRAFGRPRVITVRVRSLSTGGQLVYGLFRRLGFWRGFCAACTVSATDLQKLVLDQRTPSPSPRFMLASASEPPSTTSDSSTASLLPPAAAGAGAQLSRTRTQTRRAEVETPAMLDELRELEAELSRQIHHATKLQSSLLAAASEHRAMVSGDHSVAHAWGTLRSSVSGQFLADGDRDQAVAELDRLEAAVHRLKLPTVLDGEAESRL
jgi:hypothetical protein